MEEDSRALPFEISPDLGMEVDESWYSNGTGMQPRSTTDLIGNLPFIRFTPDGFFSEDSPQYVLFHETRENSDGRLWVGWSRNRLSYEIQTNQPILLRREQ